MPTQRVLHSVLRSIEERRRRLGNRGTSFTHGHEAKLTAHAIFFELWRFCGICNTLVLLKRADRLENILIIHTVIASALAPIRARWARSTNRVVARLTRVRATYRRPWDPGGFLRGGGNEFHG